MLDDAPAFAEEARTSGNVTAGVYWRYFHSGGGKLLPITRFYRVLLGFTRFYWVLSGFTGFLLGLTGFYRVILGFTGFY